MGVFKVKSSDYRVFIDGEEKVKVIKKAVFNSFNENVLGLGKIETESKQINALCVIFDLEGFTDFCKQIDPQLAVPEYLAAFLKWMFQEVKKELTFKELEDGYDVWTDIPFFCKYLGDGVMFLWNTEDMSEDAIINVVICMQNICENYGKDFLPKIAKDITSPPNRLRCGIARGAIYSVGNGNDFVGPCINMASRLQKLGSLTFCFARRGINLNNFSSVAKSDFTTKKVAIRGIGEDELICILKSEYDNLLEDEKEKLISV